MRHDFVLTILKYTNVTYGLSWKVRVIITVIVTANAWSIIRKARSIRIHAVTSAMLQPVYVFMHLPGNVNVMLQRSTGL